MISQIIIKLRWKIIKNVQYQTRAIHSIEVRGQNCCYVHRRWNRLLHRRLLVNEELQNIWLKSEHQKSNIENGVQLEVKDNGWNAQGRLVNSPFI